MNYAYDNNFRPAIKVEMLCPFGELDQMNNHINTMTTFNIGQILSVSIEKIETSVKNLDFIIIIKYLPCEGQSESLVYLKLVDVEELGFIDGSLMKTSEQFVKAVNGDDILDAHFICRIKPDKSFKYKYRFLLECRKKASD